jgi:hypothetical protein
VLGAAMLSPAALVKIRDLLDGAEFYRPGHQVIWQAITALADRGDPQDPLSVGAYLGPGPRKPSAYAAITSRSRRSHGTRKRASGESRPTTGASCGSARPRPRQVPDGPMTARSATTGT